MKLSDLEHHIAESASTDQSSSLLSLLPMTADELKPLLETLDERKAIVMIKHIDEQDPWVVYDEYKLMSQIDSTLIERCMNLSLTNNHNVAIMDVERLLEFLSPLLLSQKVLLNILHRFKIIETFSHGEATKYFLASVLKETQINTKYFETWQSDPKYSSGFAWCIIPQPQEIMPFFMPRFLYHMVYELYATAVDDGDIDTVIMSHLGLYSKMASELEICLTIDSSMVSLNMRCKKGEEVTCLQYRNKFLSAIHQLRQKFQPALEISEYIVSMQKAEKIPIKEVGQITEYGKMVDELRDLR